MSEEKIILVNKNFQSHKLSKLEFFPGINVVTGPNTSGKTSLVRSLRTLFFNLRASRSFINHNASSMQVGVSWRGNKVVYKKNRSGASGYQINGKEFTRLGGKTLFDFLPSFPALSSGLNLQDEWSVLFPFGFTPTELYGFYEEFICEYDLSRVFVEIKEEEKALKEKVVQKESVIDFVDNVILKVEPLICVLDKNFVLNLSRDVNSLLSSSSSVLEDYDSSVAFKRTVDVFKNLSCLPLFDFGVKDLSLWYDYGRALRLRIFQVKKRDLKFSVLTDFCKIEEKDFKIKEDYRSYFALKLVLSLFDSLFNGFGLEDFRFRQAEIKDFVTALRLFSGLKESVDFEAGLQKEKLSLEEKLSEFKVCPLCRKPLNDVTEEELKMIDVKEFEAKVEEYQRLLKDYEVLKNRILKVEAVKEEKERQLNEILKRYNCPSWEVFEGKVESLVKELDESIAKIELALSENTPKITEIEKFLQGVDDVRS